MLDALAAEARGDWSNLKGTEYHLVYVIWALLCERAHSLAFYMGNDLLARPSSLLLSSPLLPCSPLDPAASAAARADSRGLHLRFAYAS